MNIPPGFAQVNLNFNGTAAPRGAQVTFGVDNSSLDSGPAFIATTMLTQWASHMLAQQSSNITLASCRVKLGPNDTGLDAVVSLGTAGSVSAESVEPQVALLVSKVTASGGRQNRGRLFIPGIPDVVFGSNGQVVGSALTAYPPILTDWLADIDTAGFPMVILHNSVEATPTPVVDLAMQLTCASQRRRIRKVGGRRRVIP